MLNWEEFGVFFAQSKIQGMALQNNFKEPFSFLLLCVLKKIKSILCTTIRLKIDSLVSYKFSFSFQGIFSVDNVTGTLRVKAKMPSKVNNSMIVKIMAFDNGLPQTNDSAQLLIYFANVFKNAPIIDPPVITTSIKEVQCYV